VSTRQRRMATSGIPTLAPGNESSFLYHPDFSITQITIMPTYIPNYQNDLFVSYARVDNEPLVGADRGWVTTFILNLKKLLGQKLGRAEAFSLWMDNYNLSGNRPVSTDIETQLKSTATFLLILSPGYLASQWCRSEFNTFLQQVGADYGRIFMVEKEFIDRLERLPELQELRGYPFWLKDQDTGRYYTLGIPEPQPNREPEYYRTLDDLATELANTLKSLKQLSSSTIADTTPVSSPNLPSPLRLMELQAHKDLLETAKAELENEYKVTTAKLVATKDMANKAMFKNKLRTLQQQFEELELQLKSINQELTN